MKENVKSTATSKAKETKKETATTSKAVSKKPTIKKDDSGNLKKELEELRKENERLKNGKLKLSFEEAEKLYKRKAEILRQLRKYEELQKSFEHINISIDSKDIMNSGNLRLSFEKKDPDYDRFDNILKTSSRVVISEFVPFIIEKIDSKIKELTAEVETIDL